MIPKKKIASNNLDAKESSSSSSTEEKRESRALPIFKDIAKQSTQRLSEPGKSCWAFAPTLRKQRAIARRTRRIAAKKAIHGSSRIRRSFSRSLTWGMPVSCVQLMQVSVHYLCSRALACASPFTCFYCRGYFTSLLVRVIGSSVSDGFDFLHFCRNG